MRGQRRPKGLPLDANVCTSRSLRVFYSEAARITTKSIKARLVKSRCIRI
jgi:hypothetical protein